MENVALALSLHIPSFFAMLWSEDRQYFSLTAALLYLQQTFLKEQEPSSATSHAPTTLD
jgi:hypothetical protein